MSINREAIRRATMAVAMEDYYGLSEILWHLRSNYMATATEDELIHEAREIVRSLIKRWVCEARAFQNDVHRCVTH